MRHFRGLLLISFLLIAIQGVKGQTDTLFWFAAPEVTSDSNSFDRPIFLRLSAFSQSAFATISQPANPNFVPIVSYVPAYNTVNVDMTQFIDSLENKPADSVLKYGIRIHSTEPITAYYEVASTICNCNPDIFVLKGLNALGTEFIIPTQNVFANNPNFSPLPRSSFDIVATENFTIVTIVPTSNVVGHPAGVSYTVNLNAGESYSATATSQTAAGHLAGSTVSSNKPIAITIKDDMVSAPGFSCADLMGDQIVPISVLGMEYIAVKGFLAATFQDRIFITGTANNTDIFINGNPVPVATINAGQVYTFPLIDTATYITSTANIYVLQISGFNCEIGMALLPPINCTGSVAVSFTRTTNEYFGAILIVNNGAQGSFVLNGNPTLIQPSFFKQVPGTGGSWVAASVDWSSFVPLTNASLIQNSASYFHIGIINGGANTGCRYGYFSNYSNLNLGSDSYICPGDSIILDAGAEKSNVLWSTGATTNTIVAKDSGTYWVEAALGNCTLSDTIYIGFYSSPDIDLGPDTAVCEGLTFTFDADTGVYKYLWSDGSKNRYYTTGNAGTYWVRVTDTVSNCITRDTVRLSINPMPDIDLGEDTVICSTEILPLTPGAGFAYYKWQDESNNAYYYAYETGLYYVEVRDNIGCTGWDTLYLTVTPVPQVNFDWDSIYMCNRSEIYLEAGPVDSTMTYTWQDNSSLPYYTVTQPGTYWVVAGRSDCYASDTVWVGACTEFWVPNAFTPNKDGVNDIFYVFPSDVEKITRFSIYIYNRWGEQVYYSDNILMGWDGTFKGKDCPQATYSYVIIFEAAGNVPLEKEGTSRGHVTLYR